MSSSVSGNKVVNIFTGKPWSKEDDLKFIRLAPELDGLEMLYSNETHPDACFTIKILCWGLRENGEIVGLVPWLTKITACTEISDPLNGKWEGYHDPATSEHFFEPPIHKALELEVAAEYYSQSCDDSTDIVQEIPDSIGTHAVFSDDGFKTLLLKEVISWRLDHKGEIHGLVSDEEKVIETPVLPGDQSLYASDTDSEFQYYFQHNIANKIKANDPEALAAISILADKL